MKTAAIVATLGTLGACSSYTTIAERTEYAQPKWYANCVETGSKGWFWWKEDYVYSCGAGVSVHHQAAEEEMKAFALNALAQRIHGTIDSETVVKFNNQKKSSTTVINSSVNSTTKLEFKDNN